MLRRFSGAQAVSGVLLMLVLLGMAGGSAAQNTPIVGGYFHFYDIYDAQQPFFVTDVPASRLTHLVYAWLSVSTLGQCETRDAWADTGYVYPGDAEDQRVRGNIHQLQRLRAQYPRLRVVLGVGGWEGSAGFSVAAATPEGRQRLALSCLGVLREYGLDGLDIDWRYPVDGGPVPGGAADTANMPLLLAAFRLVLDEAALADGRPYSLSATVPAAPDLYDTIDIGALHPHVDWLQLTAYGFTGEWSTSASHMAPLYASVRDPRDATTAALFNVDGAVTAYLDAGVPARKIVLGVAFYAQTWRNVRPSDTFGLYQPTDGVPRGTRPGGTLFFRDLPPFLESTTFRRFFDDQTRTPWMYNAERRVAISYEDVESVRYKAAYVRDNGLGGIMAYALAYDDASATLLNAMVRELALPLAEPLPLPTATPLPTPDADATPLEGAPLATEPPPAS